MRLIILGPPGAGKGTQSKLIAKEYNLRNIPVGYVLRKEIGKKTKLGIKIKPYIERGDLASDSIVYKIIKDYLKKGNFILDGFPRHMSQVKLLKENINAAIFLDCKKETIIKRLKKRKNIKHRKDDHDEIIDYRWYIYKKKTLPVINHYRKRKMLITIDANPSVRTVFKSIKEKLNRLF